MEITKVIIPAAGLGTRFLPYTKAVPKEMVPLLNNPAIHYGVEEAVNSKINQCLFIINKDKEAIADYFDTDAFLQSFLKERNKEPLLANLNKIIRTIQCTYIRQSEPLGLGHALSLAQHTIAPKEYFAVLLPDDIVVHSEPALAQLARIARQEKASIIAVQEIPEQYISAYGVVTIKKRITPNLMQIQNVVEKPARKDAPSNLAIVGRYIFSQKIFKSLEEIAYNGHELQLTDAINHLIYSGEKVFAYKIQGIRYDIGTPVGWIKAIIGMALQHPHYAPHIKEFIAHLDTIHSYKYDSSKTLVQKALE